MTRKHPAGGGIAGWREHAPGDSVSTLKFRQLLTNVSFRQGCVNSEQPSGNVGAPRTW
jgi:hypothetical protein